MYKTRVLITTRTRTEHPAGDEEKQKPATGQVQDVLERHTVLRRSSRTRIFSRWRYMRFMWRRGMSRYYMSCESFFLSSLPFLCRTFSFSFTFSLSHHLGSFDSLPAITSALPLLVNGTTSITYSTECVLGPLRRRLTFLLSLAWVWARRSLVGLSSWVLGRAFTEPLLFEGFNCPGVTTGDEAQIYPLLFILKLIISAQSTILAE